jgi:hypothetical protein
MPKKGPPVPIVQEAWWASKLVWTQRLEEKSFAPAGDKIIDTNTSNTVRDFKLSRWYFIGVEIAFMWWHGVQADLLKTFQTT